MAESQHVVSLAAGMGRVGISFQEAARAIERLGQVLAGVDRLVPEYRPVVQREASLPNRRAIALGDDL